MTLSELLWRWSVVHQMGWTSFWKEYPPRILALTALPRVLLQSAFFVLLVGVAGGSPAEEYALIGVGAIAMTYFTVTTICDVTIQEAESGTFPRHRLAVVSPFAAFLCRSAPHVVGGVLTVFLVVAVVPAGTGHAELTVDLLPMLPFYILMAVTCTVAGLTVGVLSSPSDNYILASNVFSSLILVGSGAVIPAERLGWFGDISAVLPLHNGIAAVRASLDNGNWAGPLLAEVCVGILWAGAARAAVELQIRRARVRGADDMV
ncbi:ABC transporter permease [Streptomyces sp. NPDC057367]|uniref:ABC transporter permease n=1 Tax=Streptomyces sp. NPDC057367 TaxID=3346108 RepID=UPI0036417916